MGGGYNLLAIYVRGETMQFQTTEYLQKEITPAGRAYWKETRNRMKRKLLPSILVSMVFDILEVVLLVLISFLLQAFIDGVSETGSIDVTTTLILAAAIVIRTANTFFVNYLGWRLGLKGQELVSVQMYKNALRNDEFLSKVKSGDIVNLIGKDSVQMGERLGERISSILCGVLQTAAVLGIIFYFSWPVGIAVLVFYPLYFLCGQLVNRRLEKQDYITSKEWANTSHVRLKGIQGWMELAILKKRGYYAEQYKSAYERSIKAQLKTDRLLSVQMMLSVFVSYLLPILSVIVCTLPILLKQEVGTSSLLVVYMLSGYLSNPLNLLTGAIRMFAEDKALYRRMSDLLYFDPEESDAGEDAGDIACVDIDIEEYSYGGEEKLLKGCKLHAERGDVISVCGDSGCGKSTLFKLLVKQNPYALLRGSITYNQTPVQKLSKETLYDELQYVSQNYFVFEDTLYQNLCMGDKFTKEQVERAVELSCLKPFVEEYGLDMVLEENGKNISQGQLQRVCIARALLREPRCLLLDEPTSALDEETGEQLMENIKTYTKERGAITFIISHKTDALSRSDKYITLTK